MSIIFHKNKKIWKNTCIIQKKVVPLQTKSNNNLKSVNNMGNKITTWHGTDGSNSTSLFEYGLLIRWNSKKQHYDVIFGVPCSEDEMKFIITYCDIDGWRQDLKTDNYREGLLADIADMCGMDEKTYLDDVTDIMLLSDLITYMGSLEVLGNYYSHYYTENEIRKRLNKALNY